MPSTNGWTELTFYVDDTAEMQTQILQVMEKAFRISHLQNLVQEHLVWIILSLALHPLYFFQWNIIVYVNIAH